MTGPQLRTSGAVPALRVGPFLLVQALEGGDTFAVPGRRLMSLSDIHDRAAEQGWSVEECDYFPKLREGWAER